LPRGPHDAQDLDLRALPHDHMTVEA
jgi:hypothetical protein